jgi:AraC-like DNA-binding protein
VKIDAIAFQCGYAASPAYLKTYFKRTTGMTMSEWRRRYRQLSGAHPI